MGSDRQGKGWDARAVALIIAGTGVFWIGAIWAGDWLEWSNRTRALFDLIALAGFAFALIALARLWRARRKDEG